MAAFCYNDRHIPTAGYQLSPESSGGFGAGQPYGALCMGYVRAGRSGPVGSACLRSGARVGVPQLGIRVTYR